MAPRLGVMAPREQLVAAVAASSAAALDRPLRWPAELSVALVGDDAQLLGAFQRRLAVRSAPPVYGRGSGGPPVTVGPGTLHVLLALASPAALVPCDAPRLVNRYVRPLLRGLARAGHLAHYFGRDWVSVAGRPVAWVGFAHDATTGRAVFEAFVATAVPFAPPGGASLRGKEPGVLAGADPARLAEAIVEAYRREGDAVAMEPPEHDAARQLHVEPPWAATCIEVIGELGAGRDAAGRFRVGGDLLASRDALARLEAEAPTAGADLEARIDAALAAPGVALEGVRSLGSVRDVIAAALAYG